MEENDTNSEENDTNSEENDTKLEENDTKVVKSSYECVCCNYYTLRISQYNMHLKTAKHYKNSHLKETANINVYKPEKIHTIFSCTCGKNYSYKNNYYRHRKKCETVLNELNELSLTVTEDGNHPIPMISNDLVMQLLKQNNDLQLMLIEQSNKMFELAKEAKYVTNNTNNNNNNNQFNLNVFLNDKCKDALNLDDFVDSLQLQIKDLEETARLGYSDGISRIFINGLRELDIFKRPIHCSDLKRETIYIKEQNIWEKDDVQKTKLSRAIKAIGRKNIKQIFEWQKLYPEYNDSSSKQNDKYNKLICNTMNGSTEEEQAANLNKIIRNVTKEVVIDKAKF